MIRVALLLYRAALVLLPRDFRREWGGAMAAEARRSLEEARPRGLGPTSTLVLRLALDTLATLVREWRAAASEEPPHRSAPGDRLPLRLATDVRFTLRAARRTPLPTALVVITLAIGIGANTALFSVVNAVLLTPLPYAEPDRLVAVWPGQLFSRHMVDAARERLPSLEDVSGYGGTLLTLAEDGDPVELFGSEVTVNHFSVLGAAPVRGRAFLPEDAAPGSLPVVILSHGLWMDRFGGDADIVGRSVALQSEDEPRRTVVGVMPPGHRAPQGEVAAWIPVLVDPSSSDYTDSSFLEAVGRLRPGARSAEAAEEVRALARALQEEDPGRYSTAEVATAGVVPLARDLVGSLRSHLLVLMAAVGVVLLIACANVANLLLARTTARGREVAVRTALGAARSRLFGQFLTEGLVLGLVGGAAGVVVAVLARGLLVGALPTASLPDGGPPLDGRILLFTLAVSLAASLLFGLAPALQASRAKATASLAGARSAGEDRRSLRLQHLLISGQVALGLVAVFAAALLVASVHSVLEADPGFEPDGVLTFRLTAPPADYPDDAAVLAFFRDLRESVRQVPGVRAVGVVSRLPLGGGTSRVTIVPEGLERQEDAPVPEATHRLVGPGYLDALGIRIREGREPSELEAREGPLTGMVNATLADRFWPDGAVGKTFRGPGGTTWFTVVGVVGDVREERLDAAVDPAVYILHRDWPWRTMHVVVRTATAPMDLLPAVKEAVWSVSSRVPVTRTRTMDEVVLASVRETRTTGRLFTLFGAVAVILAAVGVYGVTAYTLGRRRHEMGVRTALGATRSTVVREALVRAARTLVPGLVLGTLLAAAAGRVLAASLESVSPSRPAVLLGAALVLTVVAATATWIPAVRAARIDPSECLRSG